MVRAQPMMNLNLIIGIGWQERGCGIYEHKHEIGELWWTAHILILNILVIASWPTCWQNLTEAHHEPLFNWGGGGSFPDSRVLPKKIKTHVRDGSRQGYLFNCISKVLMETMICLIKKYGSIYNVLVMRALGFGFFPERRWDGGGGVFNHQAITCIVFCTKSI